MGPRPRGRPLPPAPGAPGDYTLFLRKEAVELEWEGEAYLIVLHGALLAPARPRHPEGLGAGGFDAPG